jgi:cell division protein FtsL
MKLLIGTLLWVLAIAAVWEKVDVYRTGYAIEQLRVQQKQAYHEQQSLELELAKATTPEQIERMAVARLGMVRPRYDQVVLIGPRPKRSPPSLGGFPVVHTAAQ